MSRSERSAARRHRAAVGFFNDLTTIREMVSLSKLAEEMGFDSVWIGEHYAFRDAVAALGIIMALTESIRVGCSVINPFTRHPALIAMTAASLEEYSPGRVVIGLGTSLSYWIEDQLGLSIGSPVQTMRQSISMIRALLKGEAVHSEGRFTCRGMKLGFKVDGHSIPIYCSAVGNRMIRLAAEVADGVIFSAGSSLVYCRQAIETLRKAELSCGRSTGEVDVACLILCAVSKDRNSALKRLRPWIAMMLSRPGRAEIMLGEDYMKLIDREAIERQFRMGNLDRAGEYIKEEAIELLAIAGTPERCLGQLDQFTAAGVKLPILVPVVVEDESLMRFLASV